MVLNPVSTVNKIVNHNLIRNHINKSITSDIFAARSVLYASIIKDIVETGINIHQSLNNKKIPEEKRIKIAAYEAAEGALTWVVQLITGFTIANDKIQTLLYNRLFGDFKTRAPQLFSKGKLGFAVLTSLLVSSVIAKRIIVPLLATPLAQPLAEPMAKSLNSGFNTNDKEVFGDSKIQSTHSINYIF